MNLGVILGENLLLASLTNFAIIVPARYAKAAANTVNIHPALGPDW
jgi:hypothetical protein